MQTLFLSHDGEIGDKPAPVSARFPAASVPEPCFSPDSAGFRFSSGEKSHRFESGTNFTLTSRRNRGMFARMNWNRWSAFLCLCGLSVFVPAVFVPAMLVANAMDGPRWFSVWSGIREFFRGGQTFLAVLICCFSLVFPLVKFSLGLLCSVGARWLPHQWRHGIVAVTSWTAKYSMLDVMVIAMLILLVKVNEYVRILPSLGLYLFSVAILFSALGGAALRRAIAQEISGKTPALPDRYLRWPAWAVVLLTGISLGTWGGLRLRQDSGGSVQSVELSRLTNRGDLRRSVEKTLALKELASDEHKFFSRDTLRRFMELGQAVTTDAGWKEPDAWVALETRDGKSVVSDHLTPVDLDARDLKLTFHLPESVARRDIASLRLVSNIQLVKIINAPIDEEFITADGDPFRKWTNTWHGRIFSFDLQGPEDPQLKTSIALTAAGTLLALWSLAALLTPHSSGRRIGVTTASKPQA